MITQGKWWVEVHDNDTSIESNHQTICTNVSNCDADLIAAAPEMLEALKYLLTNDANLAIQQIKEDLFADAPEIKHKAIKALSKAEGR